MKAMRRFHLTMPITPQYSRSALGSRTPSLGVRPVWGRVWTGDTILAAPCRTGRLEVPDYTSQEFVAGTMPCWVAHLLARIAPVLAASVGFGFRGTTLG